MKKLVAALLTISGMACADSISTPAGNSVIAMLPAGTYATDTNLPGGNTPFYNNPSIDGSQLNAGYFVTNTGGFSSGVLPTAAGYLGQTASPNSADLSFSLVRSTTAINVTILYQNSAANAGTSFGIYDTGSLAQTQIYGPGTIPTSVGGAGTNVTTGGAASGSYGFYATVCQPGFPTNCFTFFSNTALNPSVTNANNSFVVEGPGNIHQHFALFTINGDANSFYLAFENSITTTGFDGTSGPENYGDFNDVIFKITTGGSIGGVPEPATLSMMGLGLLGLALMGRRLRKS